MFALRLAPYGRRRATALSLVAVLPLAALPLAAQPTDVPVVAQWRLGQAWDVRVTRIQHRVREGEVVRNDSTVTHFRTTVVDSTKDGYRVRWLPLDGPVEISEAAVEAIMVDAPAALARLSEAGLLVETTSAGAYVRLVNRDDLVRAVQAAVRPMFDSLRAQPDASPEMRVWVETMLTRASSPSIIEAQATDFLVQFYQPNGLAWQTGGRKAVEEDLEIPLFGHSVKMQGHIWARRTPKPGGLLLAYDRAIDPHTLLEAVRANLSPALAAEQRASLDAEMDAATPGDLQVTDTMRWDVDAAEGTTRRFAFQRISLAPDQRHRFALRLVVDDVAP